MSSYFKKKKICFVCPKNKNFSETFIENQLFFFPKNTFVLFDSVFPIFPKNNKFLYFFSEIIYLLELSFKKILGKNKLFYHYYLYFIFKYYKVSHIFCEYGTIGTKLIKVVNNIKLPLIIHFHGYDAHSDNIVLQNIEEYKILFKISSKIIVVSKAMKEKLIELGCPFDKIQIIRCGANSIFFNNSNYNVNSNYFISIGRFVDKKGPYFTVLAFKKVVDIYPQYKLKMVGDGYLLDTCIQLSKFLKLENNIEFCGVKSPEEIVDILSNSLAFVQHSLVTSYNDSEGTPVAIMEAMASGIPVISTFHAGISEIIEHNVTGFLVEECDVDKMAEYMLRIIINPNEAKEIGKNANNYAIENFNLEKNVNKLVGEILN